MYKINSLNLLKILLAFNIFLIHAQEVGLWPHFAWPDGSSAFFFVLSGFGLATGYGHQVATSWNNRRFMISRLWRFYPLHFVTLVLCVVLMWWSGTPYGIKPLACNTLLLQSWIPNPIYYFSGNGVSWFLSSLFFCYAIFGWLYRLLMHTSTTKMWLRYGAMVGIYLIVMAICPAGYENSLLYIHPTCPRAQFCHGHHCVSPMHKD